MAMTKVWTPLHKVAMGIGAFIVGVTILSNVEHIYKQVGTLYDPAIFAAFAVSIGIVGCLTFALDSFEDWKKLSSWVNGGALLMAYFAGVAYEITTTFDRTSTARDQYMERVWNKDKQHNEYQSLLIKVSNSAARTCGEANWQKVRRLLGLALIFARKWISHRRSWRCVGGSLILLVSVSLG